MGRPRKRPADPFELLRELATSLGITLQPGVEVERELDVDEYLLTDRDGTAHRGRVAVEITIKVRRRPSAEMQHGYLAAVLARLDAEPWRGGTCQRSTTRRGTFGGSGSCSKKVTRAIVRRGIWATLDCAPKCGCHESYPQLQPGKVNHAPECLSRLAMPSFDFCCSSHADASSSGGDVLAVVTIPGSALAAAEKKYAEQKAREHAELREREKVCSNTWDHPKDCRCKERAQ